jgi:hypothetical protein
MGGLENIQAARARQLPHLNRARQRIDLRDAAEATFKWLIENPLRYLSVDEEAFYAAATERNT